MLSVLRAWIQSLVGELRSHKPSGQKEKKKNSTVKYPFIETTFQLKDFTVYIALHTSYLIKCLCVQGVK